MRIKAVLTISILTISLGFLLPANDSRIYSSIFSHLVSVDDTYSGNLDPQKVYVSIFLVEPNLDFEPPNERKRLSDRDIESITRMATKLGIEAVFVEEIDFTKKKKEWEETVSITFSDRSKGWILNNAEGSIYLDRHALGGAKYEFIKFMGFWNYIYKSVRWIS